uniref:Uncharacterized protein n=1 Tax=Cannabis sativa TaxID=3483 RepID=A0A803PAM4_CANSA
MYLRRSNMGNWELTRLKVGSVNVNPPPPQDWEQITVIDYDTELDPLAKLTFDEVATKAVRKAKFILQLEEHIARDMVIVAKQTEVIQTYVQGIELALTTRGTRTKI